MSKQSLEQIAGAGSELLISWERGLGVFWAKVVLLMDLRK